jgi:hypothetical protein
MERLAPFGPRALRCVLQDGRNDGACLSAFRLIGLSPSTVLKPDIVCSAFLEEDPMGSFSIWHWIVVLIVLLIMFSPLIIGILVMGVQMGVIIRHEPSGLLRKGFYGYSWTYFLFGFFVPILRGEIGIGFLHLLLNILTFGIFQIVMPYLYNRQYMTRRLTNGWLLADEPRNVAQAKMRLKIAP